MTDGIKPSNDIPSLMEQWKNGFVSGQQVFGAIEAYKENAVKGANEKIREQIKRVLKTKEEGSYESTADFITDLEYYTSEEYLTSDMTN